MNPIPTTHRLMRDPQIVLHLMRLRRAIHRRVTLLVTHHLTSLRPTVLDQMTLQRNFMFASMGIPNETLVMRIRLALRKAAVAISVAGHLYLRYPHENATPMA